MSTRPVASAVPSVCRCAPSWSACTRHTPAPCPLSTCTLRTHEVRAWFQERLERGVAKPTREEQLRVLSKLVRLRQFENFLQTKYLGQKRFSLEGGESLIPLLDAVLDKAANNDLKGVAIGMAHRGRLNVLTNIAGKSYAQIFREFSGTAAPYEGGSG